MKEQSVSIHFENELRKLPEPDWQNEKHKHRRTTSAERNRENTTAWQINSQEKLLTEIDRNSDGVLTMILDMGTIYTKYLNQANHANKQCNQIQTIALRLEQELQINNNEKHEAITLFGVQVAKSYSYKKIIDML